MKTMMENGCRVEVVAESGNVRPYRARVYYGARLIGKTGFSRTESGAFEAGLKIANRWTAKN